MEEFTLIYRRILPFLLALPLIASLPPVLEMIQHVAEISLGFYDLHDDLPPEAKRIRLAFGAAKVLALFSTLIVALRWWASEDAGSSGLRRPGRLFFVGLLVLVVTELIGDGIQQGTNWITAQLPVFAGAKLASFVVAQFVSAFVTMFWLAWSVALLVEDASMPFVRSVLVSTQRIFLLFAYVLVGTLPLMAAHYAVGYWARGKAAGLVWAANVIDAGLVCLLCLSIASGFFSVYRRVKADL